MPGQALGAYDDALDALGSESHYLNVDRTRYYYGVTPNLRQEMEQRKTQVTTRQVLDHLKSVVASICGRGSFFSGVHVFAAHEDLDDNIGTGPKLVVMRPDMSIAYNRNSENLAFNEASAYLQKRGTSPRTRQNRLVFLFPDSNSVGRLMDTRKARVIRTADRRGNARKSTQLLFPVPVAMAAGIAAPASAALVGFLMFGNLLRECGVLDSLSQTAQTVLVNLITIVLGLSVACQMTADQFVKADTLLILALGLLAFVGDTAGGVLFAKLLNLFLPEGKKINPMIGAAGISAFPMSGRVVNQMGLKEDNQNFLLMYSVSVNVSGQISSVIAGGLILALLGC